MSGKDTLCQRLQQRCSDWGVYWRAPDSHGVDLTLWQAEELLRDTLGVEVAIKGLPPGAYAEGCRDAAMEWGPFGLTVEAALNRGDSPALLFDENSPIRDELRRLLARGMEARSGETEGLDPEGATARSATPTRPEGNGAGAEAVEALRELVELNDLQMSLPDLWAEGNEEAFLKAEAEFNRRDPLAWEAARAALSPKEQS